MADWTNTRLHRSRQLSSQVKRSWTVIASIDATTLLRAETGEVYGMGRAYTMGFTEAAFRDYEAPTLINSAEVNGASNSRHEFV